MDGLDRRQRLLYPPPPPLAATQWISLKIPIAEVIVTIAIPNLRNLLVVKQHSTELGLHPHLRAKTFDRVDRAGKKASG